LLWGFFQAKIKNKSLLEREAASKFSTGKYWLHKKNE
jgi:hypothetical protein